MKKKAKIIISIVVGILIIGYSIIALLNPMAVETMTLTLRQSEVTFVESGVVNNSGEQYIYPLVAGEIESILVTKGQKVLAGDILATLDSSAVESQIKQLEISIEGYKAQLLTAELEYEINRESLEANLNNLYGQLQALDAEANADGQRELELLIAEQNKKMYERGLEDLANYKELYDNGYISEKEYKDFEALVDSYEASANQSEIAAQSSSDYYEGMKTSINAQINSINVALSKDTLTPTKAYYQSLVNQSEASLEGLQTQLEKYNIRMAADGIVSDIMIENINQVSGVEPAFLVHTEGNSQIEVKVNTRDIETIQEGDAVKLILDQRTGDVEVSGIITYIAKNATVEISPLGIEERKVLVIVEPEKNDYLFPGYNVDVEFTVFSEGDKITIPNSAIFKKDEQDMVLVLKNGKVTEEPVVLGYELTGETIIEEGVSEGDQVILDLDAKGLKVGIRAVSSNE